MPKNVSSEISNKNIFYFKINGAIKTHMWHYHCVIC